VRTGTGAGHEQKSIQRREFYRFDVSYTSIKIRDDDKRAFDRLRHEIALQAGDEMAQHELFHRILEHALAHKERIGARPRPGRSWRKHQFDLGAPTDAASDLDRVVYGQP
jgi:hypothetical protein